MAKDLTYNGILRGVEVLVKKAAVDGAFRERLLRERARAADAIGLALTAAEAAMLDAVPAAQLERIVAQTAVPSRYRAAFMGYAAAAMLATVVLPAFGDEGTEKDVEDVATEDGKMTTTLGTGIIRGTIMDRDGETLGGALITVTPLGKFATAAADGTFKIANVPPGVYKITASRTGYDAEVVAGFEVEYGTNILQFRLSRLIGQRLDYPSIITGNRPIGFDKTTDETDKPSKQETRQYGKR